MEDLQKNAVIELPNYSESKKPESDQILEQQNIDGNNTKEREMSNNHSCIESLNDVETSPYESCQNSNHITMDEIIVKEEPDSHQLPQTRREDYANDDIKINTESDATKLFPFVCGICADKFNNVTTYFMHISMHETVEDLLHSCYQSVDNSDEKSVFFLCGICKLKLPTLCLLYNHLLETEGVTEFVYKESERTAYAFIDDSIIKSVTPEHFVWSQEHYGHNLSDDTECQGISKNNDRFNMTDKNCFESVVVSSVEEPEDSKRQNTDKKKMNKNKTNKTVENYKLKTKVRNVSMSVTSNTFVDRQKKKCKLMTDDSNDSANVESNNEDRKTISDSNTETEMVDEVIKDIIDEADCQEDIEKERALQREKRRNRLVPCEVCGTLIRYQYLNAHITTHDKKTIPCDKCDTKFSCKNRLTMHKKQVHVEEKKFICDTCGKTFKAWPYLKQHRRTHTQGKNIQCTKCPLKFRDKQILRQHFQKHLDKPPQTCEICGKTFLKKSYLARHKLSHSDERKFSCTVCSKMFKCKTDLQKHKKIHLPPKFFCEECGKPFIQRSNMRIHMKVHGKS